MEKDRTMLDHFKERFGGNLSELSLTPPLPTSLNIELNNTCNEKCEFCPVHGPSAKKFELSVMSVDFAKSIMKQAYELGIGTKEIGFYCMGEVFLYKDFPEIVAYAKELGFGYTFITTNGVLGTPDVMKKVVDAGLDSIRFSVNATNREEYRRITGVDGFEQVINNIKWLSNYKKETNSRIIISVSCVVTKLNKKEITKELDALLGEYVDQIIYLPVLVKDADNNKELDDKYTFIDDSSKENEKHLCPIPFNTMYIDSSGKVFMCCEIYDKPMRVADLKENMDLKAAWYSPELQKYRQAFIEDDTTKLVCEKCVLRTQGASREYMEFE